MQISLQTLAQIEDHSLKLEGDLHLPELVTEVRSMVHLYPFHIRATVSRKLPHRFQVDAEQSVEAVFVCSRCLKEFNLSLHTAWSEHFTDLPVENEEDSDLHPIGKQLDLQPWIREAFLLQIPFAPVCKERCRGLCPKCGIDRNEAICACDTTQIDPRLAKLQEFGKQDT